METTDRFADSLLKDFFTIKDSSKGDIRLLQRLTSHIRNYLDYTEVSFWSINRNNTPKDGLPGKREEDFVSTSLLYRETSPNCIYQFNKKEDYSHTLKQASLFRKVLQGVDLNNIFERFNGDEALKNGHRSSGFIKAEHIVEIIVIPVREIDSPKRPIAFLELSRTESQRLISDDVWERLAYSISISFSSILHEYARTRQQELIDELILLFGTNISKDSLYRELLSKLQKYCPCQGASLFLCDTFPNRYDFKCALPDIENNPQIIDYFYMVGEGFTGRAAKKGEIFISDNLAKDQDKKHKIKICEKLPGCNGNSRDIATTGIFIPIHSRTNTKDIVGIIRLINKKNVFNEDFVDFFNDVDVKILSHASNYLSPIIDAFVKEKKKSTVLAMSSHGLGCYVDNVSFISEMMLRKTEKSNVDLHDCITKLIENVAGLKISLENNLFFAKTNIQIEHQEYTNLYDAILACKHKVSTFADIHNFPINRILVNETARKIWLNISKDVINLVFFNLFTNAIKYKNDDNRQFNEIKITAKQSNTANQNGIKKPTLSLLVQDYGIGIKREQKEIVFNPGIRGGNVPNSTTGTGMGLYIVRTIIEDWLGGGIRITCCNPTTFKIDIPEEKYYIQ